MNFENYAAQGSITTELWENVLRTIYEAAIKTSDGYIMSVSLGIRSDLRSQVCQQLQFQGYITKVKLLGQDKIQCQVTEKIYRYFEQ